MLRRLTISKFRGFSRLEVDLSAVNVLLGPNSSGKSSILHAVRIACAALTWTLKQEPTPKLDGEWIVVWWDWPIRVDERFLPAMRTEELFLNKGDEPLHIRLQFDPDDFIQELLVSLRYGKSEALRLDVRVKSEAALNAVSGLKANSRRLSPALASALMNRDPIAVTIPAFYGVVLDEPYVNDAKLERKLSAGEQGSVVRNLVSRLPALKDLNDFLLSNVKSEISRSMSGQELQAVETLATHYRDKNGDLELSSAGTGLVALTALHAALQWYRPRAAQGRPLIFLLDEPEAHLHPKLQGDTGEALARLVTSFGAQTLIATHSVEMINRLGVLPETSLLAIDRSAQEPAIRLTSEDAVIEKLESFCDLSPFASLKLLRSRRIVFYEGKTDRSILEICARASFANHPVNLEKFNRWTFVELSTETNADAKDVLKKALAPLAAIDKSGDPVRLVRVLDRDHHRQPHMGPEQPEGLDAPLKEFDVVWSRYSIESLFLESPCLASWLHLALSRHSGAPSFSELQRWVEEGIAKANVDATLNKEAADRIMLSKLRKLTVGQLSSEEHVIGARESAERDVFEAPEMRQNAKLRAKFILEHVRSALPPSLRNRVRADIPLILQHALSPSTLTSPMLIPAEIQELLKYLVS